MKTIKTLGFSVFSDSLSKIPIKSYKCRVINTISPNSYGISTKDNEFKLALLNSDYLVLDGVYFALAAIILQGKTIKRNQGPDVFNYFVNKMNHEKGRIFFLGASHSTLNKIKIRINSDYPNIAAGFFSPPFKNDFSITENNEILKAINDFKPDVLFVGMTCPKQEKWVFHNKLKLKTNIICSIGAVFDWYAGNQKNIHPIWWKLRLGWLKRTIDRPEILKRYPNIGIFFWHTLLATLGNKKYRDGKI